ncbi:MAG: c-type cytochrome [Candidatus Kapaibacterium sp.]
MKKLVLVLLSIVPGVLLFQGFRTQTEPSLRPMADPLCFQRDILPILNSNCAMSGCHNAASKASGIDVTSYAGASRIVRAGNATGSPMIREMNAGAMPESPWLRVPDSLKNRLIAWISAGAANTTCAPAPTCDTSDVQYLRDIKPILQLNCVGCHQTSRAGGGLHLDNDENNDLLKETIYKTVSHTGKVAMPPNIAALSACDIAKIRVWAMSDITSVDDPSHHGDLQVLNASSDEVRVRFSLDRSGTVGMSVISASGQTVVNLPNEWMDGGSHERFVPVSPLAHGLYFLRLNTPFGMRTAKFLR